MYTFSEIKGNEFIIKNLQNGVKNNKVNHSYIFDGQSGMGKTFLAKTFAKTLQCERGEVTPCNICVSCKSFDSLNHPDVIYIEPKKSVISVEQVRESIVKTMAVKPYKYNYKIIIVDNADTMTTAAQNAILKTIEEPPAYGVFLFVSTNINNFLPTILSRCVSFKLKPLSNSEVKQHLQNTTNISDNELLDFYVAYAEGNIGYAEKLIKEENFLNMRELIIDMILNLREKSVTGVFSQFKVIDEFKSNIEDVLDIMCLYFRDAILAKDIGTSHILQKDKERIISQYIEDLSLNTLFNRLEAVYEARESLRKNGNFQMTIEVMMLKLRRKD